MYGQVATLTLLVYDTNTCDDIDRAVITMDKEINYFWGSPTKFVSLIYFAVKSLSWYSLSCFWYIVALQANETLCLSSTWIMGLSYILLLRVLALYHQDKKLAACLRTLFGLEAVLGLGVLIYTIIYAEVSVGRLAEGVSAAQYWRELAGFSQFNLLTVLIQDQSPVCFGLPQTSLCHWESPFGTSEGGWREGSQWRDQLQDEDHEQYAILLNL
ncbi:hypothetical protein DFH11DRAFT_1548357 [Phellopilus nigrolimitatus]|nr:hypothetical protein DFH11DRAFT_1548357 [Phellopilus nigrolimitatus]